MRMGTFRVLMLAAGLAGGTLSTALAGQRVDCFLLRTPGDAGDINQASDLHYGRLGRREGLWLVCDRNGGATAGKIFFITPEQLRKAKPGKAIVADEEFTVVPPAEGWTAFERANHAAGSAVLADARRRVLGEGARTDEPFLDLEAITIAPSPASPHETHLFVVSEEPYSTVLELALEGRGAKGQARLVALYAYHERADEHGTSRNDGLEGFEYAGESGEFYFAEEGTRTAGGAVGELLYFLDPRLGRARLHDSQVDVECRTSDDLTTAVRRLRGGSSQTLNAITRLPTGQLLTVDRNGGWILRVDVGRRTAERWLNLYSMGGVNLRELLAEFPGPRHMPYVSIEGIAVDSSGNLWLVDDPAMPEAFRASCLVRISGIDPVQSRPDSISSN